MLVVFQKRNVKDLNTNLVLTRYYLTRFKWFSPSSEPEIELGEYYSTIVKEYPKFVELG